MHHTDSLVMLFHQLLLQFIGECGSERITKIGQHLAELLPQKMLALFFTTKSVEETGKFIIY